MRSQRIRDGGDEVRERHDCGTLLISSDCCTGKEEQVEVEGVKEEEQVKEEGEEVKVGEEEDRQQTD